MGTPQVAPPTASQLRPAQPDAWLKSRVQGAAAPPPRPPAPRKMAPADAVPRELAFRLTPTTLLVVHYGNIVRFHGDAVVSPSNLRLWKGTGGCAYALHRAAGRALEEACLQVRS